MLVKIHTLKEPKVENKAKLNKALLNKVKKHILEEPNRLIMSTWLSKTTPGTKINPGAWGENNMEVPKCGTVGCIAGWIVLLAHPDADERMKLETLYGYNAIAKRALGIADLSVYYSGIPFEIFYVDRWPEPFKTQYYEVSYKFPNHDEAQKERAKIVAAVIDEFKKRWDELHTPKKVKE